METNLSGKLWNKDFLLWFFGSAQSAFGSSLAGIAMSFLVYGQSGSASAMGVTLALSMLPALLSPLAGTLVDRIPLRVPLVLGNVARGFIQLGLGIVALSGHVPLPVVYVLAFVNGLVGVLYAPAGMSVLPSIVARAHLGRASGLMSAASQTASLVGLVGGGVLVATIGSAFALIADGVSFLVMALLVLFVRLPKNAASTADNSFWSDFAGGVRYVRGSPLLMMLPLIVLCINAAFAPLEMLMPKRMIELGVGASGLGLFLGLLTGGMALGSLLVAGLGHNIKAGSMSVASLGCLAAVLWLLALSTQAWQLYGLAVAMGLTMSVTNVSIGVLFATLIDPAYRGRVGSLMHMGGMIGVPLTLLLLAPVADHLSIGTIFAAASVVTLLGTVAWSVTQRAALTKVAAS